MDAETAMTYLRALATSAAPSTTTDVAEHVGESERQARRRLTELRDAGLAWARRGPGGGWRATGAGLAAAGAAGSTSRG